MKRMMKFFLWICSISLNFEIYFLEFSPGETAFGVSLAATRKCKKDCNTLKFIQVQCFCSLETEIVQFPNGCLLN